ncbi:GlxA family transcriptional regulator [Oceanibacterium hippocampi]|uniref:HTH-type transcriptional regulator CdhR n=1 Tax=Oceanibacterium hippocampi TaxID=745714 RepID=A0A1Y5SW87_9PROT|nr:GlxA family transcriptional regulator [Oceanibacterium hippocampi]SLN50116.1 HTH-type transcriptional regulator CdhR [Oceanibacterium hippocampi]
MTYGFASPEPRCYGIVLVDQFPMMDFSAIIEPLRSANRLSERTLYEWRIISVDGEPVASSSGISIIADAAIGEPLRVDRYLLLSGIVGPQLADRRLIGWLRRADRQGIPLGGICTAAFLLARAGLLGDRRCTIHWESLPSLAEEFPDLNLTGELFEVDGHRFTCSGGLATADLILHLIAAEHGKALADAICDQFVLERIRQPNERQRRATNSRLLVKSPKLYSIIEQMGCHLEDPVSRSDLANAVGLSTRQVERLFRKHLGCTVSRHYREMRLQRAQLLLRQTGMSILDVSVACGFTSASHFSRCYRQLFGRSPREDSALA